MAEPAPPADPGSFFGLKPADPGSFFGLKRLDDGGGADPAARPLGDPEVQQRLTELDELLERVEAIPGPTGELALEAVSALAEVYGAALTRAMAYVSAAAASGATGSTRTPLVDAFTGDDLLGSLLALHGIHPDPAQQRVARALDDVRAELGPAGGEVTFLGIDSGAAEIRITSGGGGCHPSGGGLAETVRDAVLAAAPELAEVRCVTVEVAKPATFIPLDALVRPPAHQGTP